MIIKQLVELARVFLFFSTEFYNYYVTLCLRKTILLNFSIKSILK